MLPLFENELFRVVYIGLCFTVSFSSDFTVVNMQKTLSESIAEDKPEYKIDGYVNMGLTYTVYGVFLWLAPSVISITGPKLGLILGSLGFVMMVSSLTAEVAWVTYLGMVVAGIGGSVLWVSEGNYMVLISSPNKLSRNVGIFWVLYCASFIFGNAYSTLEFQGKDRIDYRTRQDLLYVLIGICCVATFMFLVMPDPRRTNKFAQSVDPQLGPFRALGKTWKLFWKKDTLILLLTFCYAGFQQSFGQGIYGSCIGFTKRLGPNNKYLVPLSGVVYGVGDLLGGSSQALLSNLKSRWERWSMCVMSLGCFLQVLAFVLIYLNIPDSAVFGETDQTAVITPSISLALVCSFLIGVGDSCLNTQIFPLMAALEPNFSAQTSALYKFMKSMAMAALFFASPFLGLHLQLCIMIVVGVLGTGAFLYVESSFRRRQRKLKEKVLPTISASYPELQLKTEGHI